MKRTQATSTISAGPVDIENISNERHFLYHSFPRRFLDDKTFHVAQGLKVLDLMCRFGLLLTPEIHVWRDHKMGAGKSDDITQESIRCCFTELAASELPEHGRHFGNFSLEFELKTLADLGALPVLYIPRMSGYDDYGIGSALIAQGAEASELISRIADLKQFATAAQNASPSAEILAIPTSDGGFKLSVHGLDNFFPIPRWVIDRAKRNDPDYAPPVLPPQGEPIGTVATGLFSLVNLLTLGLPSETRAMQHPLRTLAAIVQPTERTRDGRGSDPFSYYRQREWRLFPFHENGLERCTPISSEHRDALIGLDPEFFGRKIKLSKGEMPLADGSLICATTRNDKHIFSAVRRIICPREQIESVKCIVSKFGDIEVVSLESLATP